MVANTNMGETYGKRNSGKTTYSWYTTFNGGSQRSIMNYPGITYYFLGLWGADE